MAPAFRIAPAPFDDDPPPPRGAKAPERRETLLPPPPTDDVEERSGIVPAVRDRRDEAVDAVWIDDAVPEHDTEPCDDDTHDTIPEPPPTDRPTAA